MRALIGTLLLGAAAVAVLATGSARQVIEASDLTLEPATPIEGETATFRFRLHNAGATVARNVPWVLQVDGQLISNGDVPVLEPGGSVEASKGWTAVRGTHSATLIVDPAGVANADGAPAARRARQIGFRVAPPAAK